MASGIVESRTYSGMTPLANHDPITFQATLTCWTTFMIATGSSSTTITQRIETVHRLASRAHVDPLTATTQHLITFLALPHTQTGRPLAAASRDTYYRDLHAWFAYLVSTGARPDNPMDTIPKPRVPKGVPRPIPASEFPRLVADARGDLLAWLCLGGLEGFRVGDMACMRGEQIQDGGIYVTGKGGKEAVLPLHPRVAAIAGAYPRHGWWFPSRRAGSRLPHVRPESITSRVGHHFRAHGISSGGPHRLRHYFATELIRRGVPVSVVRELMRHENLATTQIYLQVTQEEASRAVACLPDPFLSAA